MLRFGNKPTTISIYISYYHYNAMFSKTMQLILLFCFFSMLHGVAHADPPYNLCPNTTNIAHDSPFQLNINNLLGSLSSNASVQNYYNTSIGYDPNGVYGLFLCYGFVSGGKCENCIATASQDIKRLCANTSDAVVWEEVCQLRYSNQRFFGELDVTGNIPRKNRKNVSEPDRFRSVLNDTLYNLTKLAAFDPSTGMYVTGAVNFTGTDTMYALVQCTTELSRDDCNTCLETAITNISSCCSFARGARLLSRSCYLRYEFYAFYEGATEFANSTPIQSTVSSDGWEKWKTLVLAIGSAIFVVALLGLCIYCFTKRNGTKKSKVKRKNFGQEVELCDTGHPHNTDLWHQNLQGREEFPFIDLATINVATDGFSDSNKLGQGGFGPVYKGILPDGKEVAVKRLSSSSEQGSDEFINEVLLILKLQHKNLVRLLGFCLDGEEMLLIYEYMPNSSLDVFLFDPSKRAQLNWSRRLNIINGIARGILYLHEDSRLRIIHRDVKASNILLDSEMNPKISDFGMARIFAGADGEANTAMIVGTYGYMAPEYAMEGLYSVKSDVFSFGVLLLEIITGRRNAGFHLSNRGPSLLAYAWQLWNEERGLEFMDPLLMDSCCPDEFLRCMHIGLLCVQEDPYERPTMSYVVVMLKSETVILSPPERPAFSVGRFADHYEAIDNICSVNLLTLSNITPR